VALIELDRLIELTTVAQLALAAFRL